jgi:hypothetical protein
VDEVPFIDEVDEPGALLVAHRLHQVAQDTRIIEPQQYLAAVW